LRRIYTRGWDRLKLFPDSWFGSGKADELPATWIEQKTPGNVLLWENPSAMPALLSSASVIQWKCPEAMSSHHWAACHVLLLVAFVSRMNDVLSRPLISWIAPKQPI
jgi:hypothetical protein